MNQLQKAIRIKGIDLFESDSSIAINDFKYFVLSHQLATLETEVTLSKNISLFASLFYEKPEKKILDDWISDSFSSHLTFSLLVYLQEQWEENRKTLFTLGYTHTKENESPNKEINPITSDFKEIFSRNFNWKDAISASVEHEDKKLFQGFLFRFRANYALDNNLYHFAMENYFYLTPQARVYVSGDLFLGFSDRSIPENSSSVKKYKDLNRLLVGGQYVF